MCVGESQPWIRIYNCNMIAGPQLACFEKIKWKVILRFWCQRCKAGLTNDCHTARKRFAVYQFRNGKLKFLIKCLKTKFFLQSARRRFVLTLSIQSLGRQRCLPSWGPRRTPWFFCNFSTVWCGTLLKLCFLGFWNYNSVIQALLVSNILCLFISTEVSQ